MNPEGPEPEVPRAGTRGIEPAVQDATATENDSSAPAALVQRMVAGGEWPQPDLLEQIVKAGEAAVEPLIAVLHSSARGWPEEAPAANAVGLLGSIQSPTAVPDLIEAIKSYGSDIGELAARSLGQYGSVVFEPLLKASQDPAFHGHPSTHVWTAAIYAAGDDPSLRARLADVLRAKLADAIERFRSSHDAEAMDEAEGSELDDEAVEEGHEADLDDITDFDDKPDEDQIEFAPEDTSEKSEPSELSLYEEIFFLINDLAHLADPESRGLIQTAFDEDMVETFFIDRKFVETQYSRGGGPTQELPFFVDEYRAAYQSHLDRLNRPLISPMLRPLRQSREEEFEEPSPPPVETIRNLGPDRGRNDPCWCGSGKKYKKCHLGKDTRS